MFDKDAYVSVQFPGGNIQVYTVSSLLSYFKGSTDDKKVKILGKNRMYTELTKIEEQRVKSLGWKEVVFGNGLEGSFLVYKDTLIFSENRGLVKVEDLRVGDLLYRYNQDSVISNDSMKVPYKLEAVREIKDVPVKDRVGLPAYVLGTADGSFLVDDFLFGGF